jgi:hypothetical protein
MRRHVVHLARAVAGPRQDRAVPHDDRADGDFAALTRRRRLLERDLHRAAASRRVHLAPPHPL